MSVTVSIARAGVAAALVAWGACAASGQVVPDGFQVDVAAAGLHRPVGIAFAPDGRMFVAEQDGFVWVVENGFVLPDPFIDLKAEINSRQDRGLLGIALDPDFASNHHVYLLYTVDPIFGEPDEASTDAAFGRLTRYTGTEASNGSIADPASRTVLIGNTPADGFPVCEPSHTIGSLVFGFDGSLFITAGDGAHFNAMDDGGLDPECFVEGWFPADEDIGAFRAQYLSSLAGKVLRVDPATGHGLPDNPWFTGDAMDNQSRLWANGLRNPYRAALRPGSPSPGTLYVGDVGWSLYEEVNVVTGGENLGWPCWEGPNHAPNYWDNGAPAHSGCDTIGTAANPGVLTGPLVTWHHSNGELSTPVGYTGRATVGGAFYPGGCYPSEYDGAYFFSDHIQGWLKVLRISGDDQLLDFESFATGFDRPTVIVAHPDTGDLHIAELNNGEIRRITHPTPPPADLDGDCVVDINDLLMLLGEWGPCSPQCPPCLGDVNEDCIVDINDLLALLASWG